MKTDDGHMSLCSDDESSVSLMASPRGGATSRDLQSALAAVEAHLQQLVLSSTGTTLAANVRNTAPLDKYKINKVSEVTRYSSSQTRLTTVGTHMPYGSHSVTCHLAEMIFLPLSQPVKAGT